MQIRLIKCEVERTECFEIEYTLFDEVTFRFSTLNECLDLVRDELIEWAAVMGLRFKTIEVNSRPWLITVIESDEREDPTNTAYLSRDVVKCVKAGLHLTDCDDSGYCNHCGNQ